MGEVRTGLLHNSTAVSADLADRLLGGASGERVRRFQRPIGHLVSPDLVTGVDCALANGPAGRVRVVGTTRSRVAITGGHVLQGSAVIQLRRGTSGRRMPWSYYLARPGVVETLAAADGARLSTGFLTGYRHTDLLDLGAIGARGMDAVQSSQLLDHRPAIKSARTRLRWALDPSSAGGPMVTFTVHDDTLRTAQLRTCVTDPEELAGLCEDLALHDWLLTALAAQVTRARVGSQPRSAVIGRLAPAVDCLLHLWMPAARVAPALTEVWAGLEHRPGFSRQWQSTVDRVRDQLALALIELRAGARDD